MSKTDVIEFIRHVDTHEHVRESLKDKEPAELCRIGKVEGFDFTLEELRDVCAALEVYTDGNITPDELDAIAGESMKTVDLSEEEAIIGAWRRNRTGITT
ncbi:MAG: Nif11-like leader peptide family natural product precursor [Planctomycetes bacterium]|nr:Nif11-like leader peptide family natural product precursor [Planctomycetota bacterium]